MNSSEFPFPPIDPIEPPSSPSESSGSRTRSSRSRSHRTTSSSPTGVPHEHERRQRDLTSSKLLSKLISREEHDSKRLRSALIIAGERLENETRRADEAERRIIEVLHRLRGAHEATMLAQAEAARANEEVRLHKLRLDEAQREIFRAQEIVDTIQKEKEQAEAEAADARTVARKFREQNLVARAREQGRRQGFQEGLIRGRDIAWREEQAAQANYDRRWPPRSGMRFNYEPVEEEEEEEEDEEDEDVIERRPSSPSGSIIHIRSPKVDSMQPMQPMQPMQHMQSTQPMQPMQPSWPPPR